MGRINSSKGSFGFTLVELLVVVAIIGILAAALAPAINPAERIGQANDARRKSDLKQIQNALETYYNDNGKYPAEATGKIITGADWGNPWTGYMGVVPEDPSSAKSYIYCSLAAKNGQEYYLYASLDRQTYGIPNIITACGTDACGTGVTCNYGVTSSNVSP